MDTDDTKPSQQPFASGPTPENGSEGETSTAPESSSIPEQFSAGESISSAAPTFAAAEPKKKDNKSLVLIIILAILALGGVGLGIYGLLKPPKEVVVYEYKEVETAASDEVVTDAKHFYLGELQTKIEIPNELVGKISYLYRDNGSILFWAYTGDTRPAYVNPLANNSYPLFAINTSREAFSDEKYSYYEGELVFTSTTGTKLYLHQTDFSASENRDALVKLSDEVMLTFVDANKYSNF